MGSKFRGNKNPCNNENDVNEDSRQENPTTGHGISWMRERNRKYVQKHRQRARQEKDEMECRCEQIKIRIEYLEALSVQLVKELQYPVRRGRKAPWNHAREPANAKAEKWYGDPF